MKMEKPGLPLHTISYDGRQYHFLFIEEQLETWDGRRVLFLRTPSGIQRVEIKPGGKVRYFGNRPLNDGGERRQQDVRDGVT